MSSSNGQGTASTSGIRGTEPLKVCEYSTYPQYRTPKYLKHGRKYSQYEQHRAPNYCLPLLAALPLFPLGKSLFTTQPVITTGSIGGKPGLESSSSSVHSNQCGTTVSSQCFFAVTHHLSGGSCIASIRLKRTRNLYRLQSYNTYLVYG